jgi:hypothetical protein
MENKKYKIGLFLVLVHSFFLFICLVRTIGIARTGEDCWIPFVWQGIYYVDFPISILWEYIVSPIISYIEYSLPSPLSIFENGYVVEEFFSEVKYSIFPHMSMSIFEAFLGPLIFYGSFGTLWYFFMPTLICKISNFFVTNDEREWQIILLLTIPFVPFWFQGLTGVGTITTWIYPVLCLTWLSLLAITWHTSQKKWRILAVLVLAPVLFWYYMTGVATI